MTFKKESCPEIGNVCILMSRQLFFGSVISTRSDGITPGLRKPLKVRKGLLPWDPLTPLPFSADINAVVHKYAVTASFSALSQQIKQLITDLQGVQKDTDSGSNKP